jgi:hypothetical protein
VARPSSRLTDFAEAFVALANSSGEEISAAALRKALDALSKQYQSQVVALWEQANAEALRLLVLVMENNPKKSRIQILKRPDVKAVLREPYLEAAQRSEELLREAWDKAEAISVKHAKSDFKGLGADWIEHAVDPSLRDALIADLHRNAKAMRMRYAQAMKDPNSPAVRLKSVADDAKTRARYSVQTGVWGIATQVKDSAAQSAGLNKMWIAVLDDATCTHCKALHGMIIGPGEQFPSDAGANPLGVYLGVLFGPPRHPNCRCVLILTKRKKTGLPKI